MRILALVLFYCACGTTAQPLTTYYQLARPAPLKIGPLGGPVVEIGALSAAPGYDRQELRTRVGNVAVRYNDTERWVAMPAEIVAHALAAQLAASGKFHRVLLGPGGQQAGLVIDGTIHALEGVAGAGGCQARLALTLAARRPISRRTIWSLVIEETRPCTSDDAAGIVQALSNIMDHTIKPQLARLAELAAATGANNRARAEDAP